LENSCIPNKQAVLLMFRKDDVIFCQDEHMRTSLPVHAFKMGSKWAAKSNRRK
jgi:hypothetical protein